MERGVPRSEERILPPESDGQETGDGGCDGTHLSGMERISAAYMCGQSFFKRQRRVVP